MFRERDRARPEQLKHETRLVDRDWALGLGMMIAVIGAAGAFCAMISGMTLGRDEAIAGYGAQFLAFMALATVFELVRRVRHLERRLDARERLDRVGR